MASKKTQHYKKHKSSSPEKIAAFAVLILIVFIIALQASGLTAQFSFAGSTTQTEVVNWKFVSDIPAGTKIRDIAFAGNYGLAVGDAGIWMTDDGGKVWSSYKNPVIIQKPFVKVGLTSDGKVGCIGDDSGNLYCSNNSGVNWELVVSYNSPVTDIECDSTKCWSVANTVSLITIPKPSQVTLFNSFEVNALDSGLEAPVSNCNTINCVITFPQKNVQIITYDASGPMSTKVPSLAAVNGIILGEGVVRLVGSGSVVYDSTNNGQTWVKSNSQFIKVLTLDAYPRTAFATAQIYDQNQLPKIVPAFDPSKISLYDGFHGKYVLNVANTQPFTGVAILSSNDRVPINIKPSVAAWVIGSDGYIFVWDNAKQEWHTQVSGVTSDLRSISMSEYGIRRGWIAGDNGTVLSTTDGKTWVKEDFRLKLTDTLPRTAFAVAPMYGETQTGQLNIPLLENANFAEIQRINDIVWVASDMGLVKGTVSISKAAVSAVCGNNLVEAGEACDPPGVQDGCAINQVCSSDCSTCQYSTECTTHTECVTKFGSGFYCVDNNCLSESQLDCVDDSDCQNGYECKDWTCVEETVRRTGGGGGGGGGAAPTIQVLTFVNDTAYAYGNAGDKFQFRIEGRDYILTLKSVSSSGATITLDNGADDNYTIQQSKNYDFDSDKFVELIMQLDSIESGNANMKLVRRIQASNIAGQINIPKEINITAEPTARFQIIAMILFAIGAVLLAFGFYKYQKREELLLGQLKREIKELERGVGKVEKKFGTSNKHAPKRKFHFRK